MNKFTQFAQEHGYSLTPVEGEEGMFEMRHQERRGATLVESADLNSIADAQAQIEFSEQCEQLRRSLGIR